MRRWRLLSFVGTGLKLASRAISRAMVTVSSVQMTGERGKPIHSVSGLGGKAVNSKLRFSCLVQQTVNCGGWP